MHALLALLFIGWSSDNSWNCITTSRFVGLLIDPQNLSSQNKKTVLEPC